MSCSVEVVIACHSASRPIGRCVASVLDGNGDVADATVVAHGLAPEKLRSQLRPEHRKRTRIVPFSDGIPSPAGPFTHGIENSRHPWVSIMGSDDTLMPGAIRSWLAIANQTQAEAVIARLALGTPSNVVPTPPVRPLRLNRLGHFTRDRLAYRSAPLGLMSMGTIQRLGISMNPGLPVGEDVIFTTRLFAEAKVAVDSTGPCYVIGEDATDRVTYVVRPIREQLAFARPTFKSTWFAQLPESARLAIAIKYLRIHYFGAVHYRPEPSHWLPGDRDELAALTELAVSVAPRVYRIASRAEADLISACRNPRVSADDLARLSARRRAHGTPATILTRRLTDMGHREAPLRFMGASAAVKALARVRPPRPDTPQN